MDDIASLITQQGEIARRRKLLEAMQGQNLQTPITGGGKGYGIGQALAKVATAYLLSKQGKELAGEEQANREGYTQALQGGIGDYLATRDGRPAQELPGPTEDGGPLMSPETKANPREAIVRAMASQMPELQAIGKADFAGLAKQQINPMDLLKLDGYDPNSKVAAALGGGVGALKGKREFKDANGQIFVIGDDGQPVLSVDARDKFGPTKNINGEAVQFAEGTGKAHQVATRPAQTNVSLNPTLKGEDAFASTLGKDLAGEFKAARDSALQGYNTKATLTQLKEMESKGVFSGPTANIAMTLSGFAQTLGIPVDGAKLANTQAYQQQVAKKIADVLTSGGGIGRSMTDADRKAFEQSLPTLLLSPQGRQYVYNQMDRDADIAINRHKALQERLSKNPQYAQWAGMLTLNPVDDAPGIGVSPPTAPATNTGSSSPKTTVSNW